MLATLLLVPDFLTSVRALATILAPSIQKWSLYKSGRKLLEWGGKGEKKIEATFKEKLAVFKSYQTTYFFSFYQVLGIFRTK